ncbi:putative sucrose utilization protein SUC1 [Tolypocladium ophioglossoides CBS 100239]|uniref:Putative sucrose utilization protein SUC1 n=1 Tax=Tolypocladium ophioglossoides (strain CBS 100239) TaxID=1163406 RepID=A0A0L0ND57_TOLOC|nr:putative sucrose utilization protein SUC1 [Tolypocladium ophioglossoides CBS 100239]
MDGGSRKRRGSDMDPAAAGRPPGPSAAKRFQVPRACQRCKARRRGCDERRPCQRCLRAGLGEQCTASSAGAWPRASLVPDAGAVQVRVAELAQAPVVDYCTQLFFELFHPTIPVLTTDHVARLRAAAPFPETGAEACSLLVAMCAHVLLHAELAGNGPPASPTVLPEDPQTYGRSLLDAALAAHRRLHWHSAPTLDQCLLAFFLYAGQVRLARHSQAFRLLREATTLWALVRDKRGDGGCTDALLDRLFWVLLISERSHAIRFDRSITLHITSRTPNIGAHDVSLSGLWCLAALFRPIDSAFMAMKNGEVTASSPSPKLLEDAERAINAAIPPSAVLKDVQKSNLRITSLWLRVIIWQLRLRLGYLTETSYHHSLTYRYPLEIAKELTLSTRDLPIQSMHVHGIGLTEKLFDIASAVVDVLARVPHSPSIDHDRGVAIQRPPEDDLVYLRHLILQLPSGQAVYNDLLEKHMHQALPSTMLQGVISQYTPS